MARSQYAFAVVALVLALGLSTAAAQAGCAPGLTEVQCKICAAATNPARCHACVASAKANPDGAMIARSCKACGSLTTPDAAEFCSNCVKEHGYVMGCSVCARAAVAGIADSAKPTQAGVTAAAGCFACFSKAPRVASHTTRCAYCYAPGATDSAGCSACIAKAKTVEEAEKCSA